MSAPAYLPLFGSDYLADTRHLSTEEHGAYLLLMMAAWRQDDCDLPADDHKLARIVGLSMRKWQTIKETILEFWTVENGRIYQGRLRKERGYADQKSANNRRAADTRWDKQRTENKQSDPCERISECNAPQPQPHVVIAKAITTKRVKPVSVVPHRMPDDWIPGPLPEDCVSLVADWPDGRLAREALNVRDYWRSTKTRRPGWDLTFHNRIRDIHDKVMRENRSGNANWSSNAQNPDKRSSLARAIDDSIDWLDSAQAGVS